MISFFKKIKHNQIEDNIDYKIQIAQTEFIPSIRIDNRNLADFKYRFIDGIGYKIESKTVLNGSRSTIQNIIKEIYLRLYDRESAFELTDHATLTLYPNFRERKKIEKLISRLIFILGRFGFCSNKEHKYPYNENINLMNIESLSTRNDITGESLVNIYIQYDIKQNSIEIDIRNIGFIT